MYPIGLSEEQMTARVAVPIFLICQQTLLSVQPRRPEAGESMHPF
jgi:hypothetical protein